MIVLKGKCFATEFYRILAIQESCRTPTSNWPIQPDKLNKLMNGKCCLD